MRSYYEDERECGCPPQVKWCTHYEGVSLALYDVTLAAECHYARLGHRRYVVSTMRGEWKPNKPWCDHPSFKGKTLVKPFATQELPKAEAEYERRRGAL